MIIFDLAQKYGRYSHYPIRAGPDVFNLKPNSEFNIDFIPEGKYYPSTNKYLLEFTFKANIDSSESDNILIHCVAEYEFQNVSNKEEIPSFFYANSIAILFPYIRAFVSTVTLQANVKPLMLPTMNLSSLNSDLANNTTVVNE